ncbi:MAG: hypothetical protein PHU80_03180 [Kiritimatiellae bacterium]|nr:hypothetical protein [Kiritimatiellia bacterium]
MAESEQPSLPHPGGRRFAARRGHAAGALRKSSKMRECESSKVVNQDVAQVACRPSPVTASKRLPHQCCGQAAIEFCAALLLFLIVTTGLLHISRLARTSLFLHAVLRGDAGERAMREGTLAEAPAYIADWNAGADGVRYTADDRPVRNAALLPATLSAITAYSAHNPGDWSHVASDSRLPVSMIRLQDSPGMAAALGFTHASETLLVPVDPVIRQLVYDKDEVAIREEVWMPLMGGLY